MLCATPNLGALPSASPAQILLPPMNGSGIVQSASGLERAIETRMVHGEDLALEPGCIYAILTSRNELGAWNWSFYVPNDKPEKNAPIGSSGILFHVVMDAAGVWKFEVEHNYDVISSQLVVAVVKLASLEFLGSYEEVIGEDGLLAIFKMVPIPDIEKQAPGDFSSRTWFLESIGTLSDCGILTCEDVWLLEREIRRCAFLATDNYLNLDNQRQKSQNTRAWTLYVAQHCS